MFILTEAALQLSVAAIGAAVLIHNTNNLIDDALAIGTGQYMVNVANAVNTYVFDNMTVLAASPTSPTTINAGSVSAVVAKPLQPSIEDLINLKLLPIGFSDISPLGVSFRVELTPTNCTAGLTNCTIPGRMYSTTAYTDASGRIRTDQLASVVAAAGGDAGVSYAESPGTITGLAASWSAPNPLPGGTAGVLMMRVGATSLLAQSLNQFYRRDGLWNLTGPMDANNQSMNAVGNLQSNGSLSAAGNIGANGQVSGGSLRSSGDATIQGNASANGVYGNYLQSNGDVRANGSAYVNGSTVTGSVQSSGNVNSGGSMVAGGYVYATGALVPSIGGGQQVWDGWGCGDPQGAIRSDPNGKTLSCQNGVWRAASGTSDGNVVSGASFCEAWCYVGICVTRAGAGGRWGNGGWICAPGTEFIATSAGSLPGQGSGG